MATTNKAPTAREATTPSSVSLFDFWSKPESSNADKDDKQKEKSLLHSKPKRNAKCQD
jgi:hypothetical protein